MARLLIVTESFADTAQGDENWRALLKAVSDEDGFAKTGNDVSPLAVASYCLTRKTSPSSIISCVTQARENARSLRHLMSVESWVQMAGFYARTETLSRRRIPLSKLSQICETIRSGCQAHYGVMEATCYRDEVWLFHRLGITLERADQMTRLLDMKYYQIQSDETHVPDAMWWITLLRSASGYHAFRRRYSYNPKPEQAASYCLYDADFPRSVSAALTEAMAALSELITDYGASPGKALKAARKALAARAIPGNEPLQGKKLHKLLDDIQGDITGFSSALSDRYFQI